MQKKFFPASELLHCLGILGGTLLYSLGMNLFVVPAGLYTCLLYTSPSPRDTT